LRVAIGLVTLRDAALYITKLPKAEHDAKNGRPRWRRFGWLPNLTATDVPAHRRDEGLEPSRRAGV
jgi:hypothetical protein